MDKRYVDREFDSAVVMAKYGPNRTYKVHRICWDMSPESYYFDQGETSEKVSMLAYFVKAYQMKISIKNQPLFEIKQKRQNIYLPPELCTLVGIPPKIRENKKIMAEIRQSLF